MAGSYHNVLRVLPLARFLGVGVRDVVFLLFAEERGLLPADNDLYANSGSIWTRAYHQSVECGDLRRAARVRGSYNRSSDIAIIGR